MASAIGLFGSRDQTFKATAKGATRDRIQVQWDLVAVVMGMAGLTLGGILLRVATGPAEDAPPGVEAMTLVWSMDNLATLCVASMMGVEAPRYRKEERFAVREPGEFLLDGRSHAGRLGDMPLAGCRIEVAALPPVAPGAAVAVRIADVGLVPAEFRGVQAGGIQLSVRLDAAQRTALVRKLFSGRYRRSVSALSPLAFGVILWRRAFP